MRGSTACAGMGDERGDDAPDRRRADVYSSARIGAAAALTIVLVVPSSSRVKLCTVCGVLTSRPGSRCTTHERQSNRSRHNALYSTRAWQRLSTRVLRAWRGQYGNWCQGYQRAAHGATDLTVD